MKLNEIMSPVSVAFEAGDSLLTVACSLADRHYSCGLICEYDKPVGIITERDIVRIFAACGSKGLSADIPVRDFMTHQPICLDEDTELLEALDLAKLRNLRHLPVVDSTQRLIGLVTLTDMVKVYLATLEQNRELQEENQKLHVLSIEDPLTGLANRRAMEIDLRHAAATALRTSDPYSIALLDIDYFKKYNDHYGHEAGDEALAHVGRSMHENHRETDKVFRYGGDEFLLLMPLTSIHGAVIAAQRLGKALSESNYPHSQSSFGHLTVSIGVGSTQNGNWEALVDLAAGALYDAKEEGRNSVCMVNEPVAVNSDFWDLTEVTELDRPAAN